MSAAVGAVSRPPDSQPSVLVISPIPIYQAPTAPMVEQAISRSIDPLSPPVDSALRHPHQQQFSHPAPQLHQHHHDAESKSPHNLVGMSLSTVAVTGSPSPIDVDLNSDHLVTAAHLAPLQQVDDIQSSPGETISSTMPRVQPMSLSYPGALHAVVAANTIPATPARGTSYPMLSPSGQSTPLSGKSHKCPYCETVFTRQHNLKSHLLTHSQEKPYLCQDCSMRFRRLHDLKRHSKLHTGEKPHICPKCERKFARGDALARHAKGGGGCAGRRQSIGSYVDGDELDPNTAAQAAAHAAAAAATASDDSVMDGVVFTNDDGDLTEEERLSHAHSYPPATMPRNRGPDNPSPSPAVGTNLHVPPTTDSHIFVLGSGRLTVDVTNAPSGVPASLFSAGSMTESPKALTPDIHQSQNHQQSPRPQQAQQSEFRRPDRSAASLGTSPIGSKLGDLVFNHDVAQQPPQDNQRAMDSNNMFSGEALWSYMQSLQDQVKTLSAHIANLERAHQNQLALVTDELTALKKRDQEQDSDLQV